MKNNGKLKKALEKFRESLDTKYEGFYDTAEYLRRLARFGAIQFKLGEWVLMSTVDIPARRVSAKRILGELARTIHTKL